MSALLWASLVASHCHCSHAVTATIASTDAVCIAG